MKKMNKVSEDIKKSTRKRIITAIVMTIVMGPLILLGDYFFLAFALFIIVFGTIEFVRCTPLRKKIWAYIICIIFIAFIAGWPVFRQLILAKTEVLKPFIFMSYHVSQYFNGIFIASGLVLVALIIVFLGVFSIKGFKAIDGCFIFSMLIIMGLGIQGMLYCRYLPYNFNKLIFTNDFDLENNMLSCLLFVDVLLGIIMNDVGAYIFGILFGKRTLNAHISPNKTVEGFFGGIISSFVITTLFGIIISACGLPLLEGVLDLQHWYFILLLSLLIPFLAVVGDLIFSAIKRYYKIKDYGNIFPGHGGVLDRFDSSILAYFGVSILIYCLITLIELL